MLPLNTNDAGLIIKRKMRESNPRVTIKDKRLSRPPRQTNIRLPSKKDSIIHDFTFSNESPVHLLTSNSTPKVVKLKAVMVRGVSSHNPTTKNLVPQVGFEPTLPKDLVSKTSASTVPPQKQM